MLLALILFNDISSYKKNTYFVQYSVLKALLLSVSESNIGYLIMLARVLNRYEPVFSNVYYAEAQYVINTARINFILWH